MDRSWHAAAVSDAILALKSDAERGLSDRDAEQRLRELGANELPEPKRRSLASIVLHQLKSPLIYLLLAAAAISTALGEINDALVIGVVVLINAIVGAFQEGRAERSLRGLRKLAAIGARVLRDGGERNVEARALVPGDIVILAAGDAVPADARVIFSSALQVSEAALTGESAPIPKGAAAIDRGAELPDRESMVYAGTLVTAGHARCLVVATGVSSEIGKIAGLAENTEQIKTPLERRIDRFSRSIAIAAFVLFAVILAAGTLRGVPFWQLLMVGISQLVGIIPEGLPVALTIALAVGVQRMARKRTLVRRLSAIETLGATTVICADKTGTLTKNEMTVTAIVLPSGRELAIDSAAFDAGDEALHALLEAAVLCNDATLGDRGATGDPTETALLAAAVKGGVSIEKIRAEAPRTAELPFDPSIKMMATEHRSKVFVKGAPEEVIALCGEQTAWSGRAEQLATRGLRVLAFAVAEGSTIDPGAGFAAFRGGLKLLGLIGQIDPPRPEVKNAVEVCRAAGVRPVMITGDHRSTALAIARELGIARAGDEAIDGRELSASSDEALLARLDRISVYARVLPAQKLRIVELYRRRGHVVAMTGDGVNDAPALARADVGVAMGKSGTEVAKEASKIVITDDNFATIVSAVAEGRVCYRNIKKAILLLFATSTAEVLILLIAMLIGYPPPFAAVQILWNNLVTEGLITINLVMDPATGDEMKQPPIPKDEPLLSRLLLLRAGLMAPAIVVSTLGWFVFRIESGVEPIRAQTEAFTLLAVCEWFNVLNCRSETGSALSTQFFRNHWLLAGLLVANLLQVAVVFWPPMNKIFHTAPFGSQEVLFIAVAGTLVLWVEEARKFLARRASSAAQRTWKKAFS